MIKKIVILLTLTSVLILATLPLFTLYVPGTADGLAHKFRVVSFKRSLEGGHIRPRWLSDQALGFGSPIFMFNYLLPYYVIAGLNGSGFTVNLSTQIFEGLTLILSGIFMFLMVRKLWGGWSGLCASAIYTLAPYHLQSIYLYEGWGEMTSYIFPPLIFLLTLYLSKEQKTNNKQQKIYYLILILSWSLFILSHNVSVLMFTPFLLSLSAIIGGFKKRGLIISISAFVFAFLLTTFFWLPAVIMNKLTQYPNLIAKEMGMRNAFFKSLSILFQNSISTIHAGVVKYYDFTLGLPILITLAVIVVYVLYTTAKIVIPIINPKKSGKTIRPIAIFDKILKLNTNSYLLFGFICMALISLFLSNQISNKVWDFPLLHFIVYPFRFLFPVTFAVSIIAGWMSRKSIPVVIAVVILSAISGWPFVHPYVDIFPFPDSYFQQIQTLNNPPFTKKNMATIEFLPKWVNLKYMDSVESRYFASGKLPDKFILNSKTGKVKDEKMGIEKIQASFDIESDSSVTINSFYFPNWEAKIDGRKVSIAPDSNGLMSVFFGKGNHNLELKFGISNTEKIANIISFLGLVILFAVITFPKKIKLLI
jgi:hypothetical protein